MPTTIGNTVTAKTIQLLTGPSGVNLNLEALALSGETAVAPFVEKFTPGYMERALAHWPKQGSTAPWRVYQNYVRDAISLKWSPVDDHALEFSNPPEALSKTAPSDLAAAAK